MDVLKALVSNVAEKISSYPGTTAALAAGAAAAAFTFVAVRKLGSQEAFSSYNGRLMNLPDVVDEAKTADVLIVGGGSAGGVLAAMLAEQNPDVDVLLIEEGPVDSMPASKIPLACIETQMSQLDRKYRATPSTECCLGLNNKQSAWPRGRCLGGSSALNYICYCRGNPDDYDRWGPNWRFSEFEPFFRQVEARLPIVPQHLRFLAPITRRFYEVITRQLGFPHVDYNMCGVSKGLNGEELPKSQEGFSFIETNTRKGVRQSTSRAFVLPALQTCRNLRVVLEARVDRVLFDKDDASVATGVEVTHERTGLKTVLHARKEVVLCGGAIGSPQMLMLSGVGPAAHLQSLGISVVKDLPAVGRHLKDHLVTPLTFRATGPLGITQRGAQTIPNLLRYFVQGKGVLSSTTYEAFLFDRSSYVKRDAPDLQLAALCGNIGADHVQVRLNITSELLRSWGNVDTDWTQNTESFSLVPTLLHPESEGTITLRSSDPADHPIIDPRYFADIRDLKVLVEGIKKMLIIARKMDDCWSALVLPSQLLKKHKIKEASQGVPACPPEDIPDRFWEDYARHMTLTLYHPTSTCRMSTRDSASDSRVDLEDSVVDQELRVHGFKNLRVCDASVFPDIISGNTNAPCMAVGAKCAHLLGQAFKNGGL